MLTALSQLLADDSDSAIKFIFGGIVLVIWVIGGIMSSMRKKGQQPNQQYAQQDWSHLLRDLTAGQNKPFIPSTPAPPHLPTQSRQQQQTNRQRMQQPIKSFAQQSPRPFVQQYLPQKPPPRVAPRPQRTIQPPRPIQRKPTPQRRPPPIPGKAFQVARPPEAQIGLIRDSAVTMLQVGGATEVETSTARSGRGPLTRGQLRKLVLWSEVLSPPLSLRE